MKLLFAFAALVFVSSAIPASDVEVKQTTYADLEKAIQSHQGKVVLVDVWSLA
jgi:hypothetical protein